MSGLIADLETLSAKKLTNVHNLHKEITRRMAEYKMQHNTFVNPGRLPLTRVVKTTKCQTSTPVLKENNETQRRRDVKRDEKAQKNGGKQT